MKFFDFNFVTMFCTRKVEDEHRIMSQARDKEDGFSA